MKCLSVIICFHEIWEQKCGHFDFHATYLAPLYLIYWNILKKVKRKPTLSLVL
jgi:hypothetical protein